MSRQFSQQPWKSTSSSDNRNHSSVTLNSDSGHQTRMADGETSGSLSAVSSSSSQNSSVSIDTSLSPNEDQLTPGIAGNTSEFLVASPTIIWWMNFKVSVFHEFCRYSISF